MRDDKVEVIIPQERHKELLQRENAYFKLLDSKSIIVGYKYLDLKSARSVLMEEKDNLELIYHIGDGVPQDFIDHVETIKNTIIERLGYLNETRLDKIEAAKEWLRDEVKWREERKMPPTFDLLIWLGLKKDPDAR